MKRRYIRVLGVTVGSVILLTLLGAYALLCSYIYLAPSLPSAAEMRNVELQVPLRVYTRNGRLIAQIGQQRRIPIDYEGIPLVVRQAVLAAEDDRFFEHNGIDYPGVMRAVLANVLSGAASQGASTITMQAARNMFLTLDKTWRRKLQEVFLTYRMEREFTKPQILGLYLNVIYFGKRSYGVAAAAETFFGKTLDQLTVAEAATLAGIAQLPSRYNPIANPKLATMRRGYVLRRMQELGYIDAATAQAARSAPMLTKTRAPLYEVEAPYVAEMARLEIRRRFGEAAESAGFRVYTSLDDEMQSAANRAVRTGLLDYDRRHGWRGALRKVSLGDAEHLEEELAEQPSIGGLTPAVVTRVTGKSVQVYLKGKGAAQIEWEGLSWARKQIRADALGPQPKSAAEIVSAGDVVYVMSVLASAEERKARGADASSTLRLAQAPEPESALVALDPHDGATLALVGGFDYFTNKYNHVTQAQRQPGSAFKPFLYSAALETGFTPASIILDAPVVLEGDGVESAWRPENSGGGFHGPTRLRDALARSRNLVSIRLLRELGMGYTINYATRFGFAKETMPSNLTLALGTLHTTPLQMAAAYAVFANGGFRITPYFIDRIENPAGETVYQAEPAVACPDCVVMPAADPANAATAEEGGTVATAYEDPVAEIDQLLSEGKNDSGASRSRKYAPRVISPQNAWLMSSLMRDVITRGTGRRALALGRSDIVGKTGTTNESKDTWFNGFTSDLVATVWVGFDQARPLGENEEGGRTALPIWVDFMREALKGLPERQRPMPDGLVSLPVSAFTGQPVSADDPEAIMETFMVNHLPVGGDIPGEVSATYGSDERTTSEPLF